MTPEDDEQLIAILKWTMNPRLPTPGFATVNEDYLAEMAVYHRIVQRLLSRVLAGRPRWASSRLLTRLRILQHQCRQTVHERLRAAAEIDRAMRSAGQPRPIWVKGFTAYAVTGDAQNLHYSGDLDPFAEDLPAFWDILHGLGYFGKRKHTHEWAKLNRGEITLDIHEKFPLLAYPKAVRSAATAALSPDANPGHWRLPDLGSGLAVVEKSVLWEHLAAETLPGIAEGAEELRFPSPIWMCLIHCAHCFRSSITRLHYMDPRGGFRLYELANIYALARHPAFDATRFVELVYEFGAEDALSLMEDLAVAFLGDTILPERLFTPDLNSLYPEQLIYGGWVGMQQTDQWLLLRGIDQMVAQLQPNRWQSGARHEFDAIPRRITMGNPRDFHALTLDHDKSGSMVHATWEIDAIGGGERDFLVHFGFGAYVRAELRGNDSNLIHKDENWPTQGRASLIVEREEQRTLVYMTCPVPEIPAKYSISRDPLSLFLAARLRNADNSEAICYVPLLLLPGN